MSRRKRTAPAGLVFHVVNRGAQKGRLFETADDYCAFEGLLVEATRRFGIALFAYCLMPNHWHFIVSPGTDGALSRCMHWLTTTHARRRRHHTRTSGQGAVYQGRFKMIPIEAGNHLLWVCRYVERNACRAGLVDRAEDWPWCSLWQRQHNDSTAWLSPWPVPRPDDWLEHVNRPQTASELDSFRLLVQRGIPFGENDWQERVLTALGRPRRRARAGSVCGDCPDVTSDPGRETCPL